MSCQTSDTWANLLPDLLLSITDNFDVTTSIRLSTVCTSWASTIIPYLPSFPLMHHNQPIPWLLCSARNSNINPSCSVFTFYDVSNAKYFDVQIPIPSLCEHHWMGSYKGWLVTLDRQLQLHLIKPLTGTHVLLPSKGLRKNHPKKVIMCKNPDNFKELQAYCVTHEGLLFSMKLGDKKWSWMANSYDGTGYQDITVHEGKIYALTTDGMCYWNLGSPYNKRMTIDGLDVEGWTRYILDCKGELIMLFIDKEERVSLENHAPERVMLCEIEHEDDGNRSSCSLVNSLGGDALFFGTNSSYVVSISSDRDEIYVKIAFILLIKCRAAFMMLKHIIQIIILECLISMK
ncbi:putative F-box protein At4g17565 [Carex rostrata]